MVKLSIERNNGEVLEKEIRQESIVYIEITKIFDFFYYSHEKRGGVTQKRLEEGEIVLYDGFDENKELEKLLDENEGWEIIFAEDGVEKRIFVSKEKEIFFNRDLMVTQDGDDLEVLIIDIK